MRKIFLFLMAAMLVAVSATGRTQRKAPARPADVRGTKAKAVDLGLSVKWADHNLGASRASDFGTYLAWGALKPSRDYADSLCTTWQRDFDYRQVAGDTLYDAAATAWGEGWRMPTGDEMKELIDSCTWTFTKVNNVSGYRVTGPSGQHIFLPAAGYIFDKVTLFENIEGYYWSAEPIGTRLAGTLMFNADSHSWFNFSRSAGVPLRPVIP